MTKHMQITEKGEPIELRKYMEKSLEFVLRNSIGGLFLRPGLGKTLIILLALYILKKRGIINNLVVVASKRIIYQVWPKEVRKFDFPFSIGVLHGAKKDKVFNEAHDLYLINYDGFRWLEEKLRTKKRGKNQWHYDDSKFDMLFIDESSKVRNGSSKRYKYGLKKFLHVFSRRYIGTGSPRPKSMMNLHSQIYCLDLGKALSPYITEYRSKYFHPVGYMGYDWALNEGAEEKIYKAIRHLIIKFGDEELELPPLSFNDVIIQLSPEVMAMYYEMEDEYVLELSSSKFVVAETGAASKMKMRQIVSGFVYTYHEAMVNGKVKKVRDTPTRLHTERLDVTEEIVDELQGAPCLIVYEYDEERDMLLDRFPDASVIDGRTKPAEGVSIEQAWNAGDIEVLIGQMSAVSHGLNIQESGSDLIMYSLTYDLEAYEQVIKRLHRSGQKNPVRVHRLIAEGTIDEHVAEIINIKDIDQKRFYDMIKNHYVEGTGALKPNLVIDAFHNIAAAMPASYPKNKDTLAHLRKIVSGWSFDQHRKFLLAVANFEDDKLDLRGLYRKSINFILEACQVRVNAKKPGEVDVNSSILKKFTSAKTKKLTTAELETPPYLSMDPKPEEEKVMVASKSKFAAKGKKPSVEEKATASVGKAAGKVEKAVASATGKKAPVASRTEKVNKMTGKKPANGGAAEKATLTGKVTRGTGTPAREDRKQALALVPKNGISVEKLVVAMQDENISKSDASAIATIKAMQGKGFINIA